MNFIFRLHIFFTVLVLTGVVLICPSHISSQTSRPTTSQVTIEKKLIDGKKYILLGDWEKAEALFRAILEEDVQNSAACYELSRTLAATGDYSNAISYIHKAIRIEPDNEWYLLMEADIREKSGDLFATMAMYDRLILLRPHNPHYYEMQISLCKKTGDEERLLKLLDQYEHARGLTESITRTRFETLDRSGRTDEALAALHKLTMVYPVNTDYKFLAASYARKTDQEDKAKQYYRDVLAIDPQNSRAKLAMANSEKQEGDDIGYLKSISPVMSNPGVDPDIKIKELIPYVVDLSKTRDTLLGNVLVGLTRELINAHPKDAKAYAIHGDVLSILGRRQPAIEAYTQSTFLNGSVYVVWEQLLAMLLDQRSYDELIRQSGLAISNFPNQAYLYYTSGFGLYKKERYREAIEVLNEALLMTGRNAGQKVAVLNIIGLAYDESGELEKSSNAFESALTIDPKSPETLAHYSLMLSRRISQSEKALSMTEKALAHGSLTPMVHEILAQVLYNQKKYKGAYASVQEVLKADPYGDAYNLAGDILIKLGNTEEAVGMWQKALDAGCNDPMLKGKISDPRAQ
ncbi:MAG: tetratricopeptide repeat protein [Saprospiraceae bacterium]|mgnify:CR=1 FL=1|nr:tetratricopeptide repeat protein [Saprospiraceae bacterium]